MSEPLIFVVGAADTGRAPMAAAMLRRLLVRRGFAWAVESAGVVGHDDAPAEPEARSAMIALGLDISEHRARSLTDEHVAAAALLLAVDTGVARVLRARYPAAAVASLGELAGRGRDIPDPFRMQVGAWLQYAGEIEAMLSAGLPRLRQLVEGPQAALSGAPEPSAPTPGPASPAPEPLAYTPGAAVPAPEPQVIAPAGSSAGRVAAVDRAARLLGLFAELPGVVDWPGARRQLEADLALMEQPLAPGDLARPYVALVRAMLGLAPGAPSAAQAAALRDAVARLRAPLTPADLEALSETLARFQA